MVQGMVVCLVPAVPGTQLGLPTLTVQRHFPFAYTHVTWFNFGNYRCCSMKVENEIKKLTREVRRKHVMAQRNKKRSRHTLQAFSPVGFHACDHLGETHMARSGGQLPATSQQEAGSSDTQQKEMNSTSNLTEFGSTAFPIRFPDESTGLADTLIEVLQRTKRNLTYGNYETVNMLLSSSRYCRFGTWKCYLAITTTSKCECNCGFRQWTEGEEF